ncbi:MAG: sensor domain-containing diguanylate cyclase [Rhodocyclaceae bacterium]|nr:MAG: sensor domain-containing diguanylate cyclase [Rhodocyclaceae bacterium]
MDTANLKWKVLKKAPVLIWHADSTGSCDWFNDLWLTFTGRAWEQERGDGWTQGVHREDLASCIAVYRSALAARQVFTMEYRLRHHSGEYRWILDKGMPDDDGDGYTGYCFDITDLKTIQYSLEEQGRLLKQAQEIARLGYYTYDMVQNRWESSDILDGIFGIDKAYPRDLESWLQLVEPASREHLARYLEETVACRQNFHKEYRIIRPSDGEMRCVQGKGLISYDDRGCPLSMVGTIRDVTEEVSIRDMLAVDATVFDHSQQAILITDANRCIVRINEAFTRITGYVLEEVRGKNPRFLNSGIQDAAFYESMWHSLQYTGQWRNEIWNRRKDGSVCPGILNINAVHDDRGNLLHYVGVFTEITELKNTQRNLERLVNFDSLTGLPNRVLMMDRLQQALSNSSRYKRLVAVCFLDLDNFKPVNDQHGHARGDALLVEVAGRLTSAVRGGDTVARLGGDEFILLLTELEHGYELEPALDRILETMAQPYEIGGGPFIVTATLGATLFPRDYGNAETLLRHADIAMYRAKQGGRNQYRIYTPET